MAATSSAAPTSSPKVSMFVSKAGFVIPKNKLTGSLVPTFRVGKRSGGNDAANGEISNQVQRKTKWGPDLTKDASVMRGRALAYQTRVDQISQQLKSGTLEVGEEQDSLFDAQIEDASASNSQINDEVSNLLNLERREAIGEILKLNPSYKAPADYKPVLKEARVPIPVKEYPGYNFLGLIFGPGSGTQKRLEKETGAKIKVHGTRVGSQEKVEVSPSDGNDFHIDYEELYILVSAETFEKVDAAVSLIEMLVTSVSGNLAAVSSSTSLPLDNANQSSDASPQPTVINQGSVQPMGPLAPVPSQVQFQFPGPTQSPLMFSSSFYAPQNFSAPSTSNPVQLQPLFGTRPALQNPHAVQNLTNPYMVRPNTFGHNVLPGNYSMQGVQPSYTHPNISAPLPFTGNQPQPGSSLPSGPLPDQQFNTVSMSSGWSRNPAGIHLPLGPNNAAAQFTPLQRPQHTVSSWPPIQPSIASVNRPAPGGLQMAPMGPPPNHHLNHIPGPTLQLMNMPKQQHPGSAEFTFQPYMSRPGGHVVIPESPTPRSMMQAPGPQPAPFGFSIPNLASQPLVQGFARPQMDQPRLPLYSGPQMGMLNFTPQEKSNVAAPIPPRTEFQFAIQQNFPRPNFADPGQRFNTNITFVSGHPAFSRGQQVYDPFSPSSASLLQQQQGGNLSKGTKQDNDPEYEDLMASVGVK